MARSQKSSIKQSLLSRIPKPGREAIARIMEERDGKMPLEQFLAKRWNFEEFLRADGFSKREVAQRVSNMFSQMAAEYPGWSQKKIRTAISLSYMMMDLKEVAIARRFTLEDPAELARGLGVLGRVRSLNCLIGGHTHFDFEVILEAFAVRDMPAAARLAEGSPAVSQGKPGFFDLYSIAVAALLQRDFGKVLSITGTMSKEKLRPWQEGTCTCLAGIADRQPRRAAEGLMLLLDGMRNMRQKDELVEAIYLPVHGLYRFAEWISPDLVAQFDVTPPLPWDAELHAWCESHPDPLAGIELSGISPVLHQAVVLLQPPAEWIT